MRLRDIEQDPASSADEMGKDKDTGDTMVDIKPVNVCFGATNYGPLWRPVVDSWLRVVGRTSREMAVSGMGKVGGIGVTDRTYTHQAEIQLAVDMLDNPDATHLFMTECDMILPDDTILKLLALDKDVAAGLYFIRNGDGQPCLYEKVFTLPGNPYPMSPVHAFPTDRPFKVHCPGLGCVLFKRSVFERVPKPWFDLKADNYGSDLYFFTKVKDAGIEVWVDPSVRPGQIDTTVIGFEAYEEKLKKDPEWISKGVILS